MAWDHPRIRGEHYRHLSYKESQAGSSPHTRGALRNDERRLRPSRIIPAYAGSTSRSGSWSTASTDHPRIRGEHLADPQNACYGERIIPAYAGSTLDSVPAELPCWDHPRIRGEHSSAMRTCVPTPGSSPHTRGALLHGRQAVRQAGIIPAYAGSTRHHPEPGAPSGDHPRIRGEHDEAYKASILVRRIIPAYAGSTYIERGITWSSEDHPRIRGEHIE